ncbi:MAG: hypothetical protein QM737_10560 [Ferruginibacter sp.]
MYNQKEILKNLKKQRSAVEKELAKLNRAILALDPNPVPIIGWKDKAVECIEGFNCYSQTVDILNCVFINSPEILEDEILRRRYLTALSVALGDMVKIGQLVMFKLYRVKGSFYGFPHWFNKDGSLQEKYYSNKASIYNMDWNSLIVKDKKVA